MKQRGTKYDRDHEQGECVLDASMNNERIDVYRRSDMDFLDGRVFFRRELDQTTTVLRQVVASARPARYALMSRCRVVPGGS
jgi:hypothetical protein